eukprot:CAMPEP_0197178942 /NCGR_PEP_ID=MMETSP1423-20130617/4054_1 /TAXON_ID=476441 /ORGANISM="Pseudo-nitzschia heimii, Strain UNC1101" /LENGTH=404 /DNA_ID=CAMNT_0042628767 /DNA_START=43 /DNA_END=1257 /DNA_ORIENTATION=+
MNRFASCGVFCAAAAIAASALRTADAFVAVPAAQHHRRNRRSGRTSTTGRWCEPSASGGDDDAFEAIVAGLDALYPPVGLNDRIALSRRDGYWPYIATGEDPPQELVYGEFEIPLLRKSLDRALGIVLGSGENDDRKTESDIVFCDLGSGTGRLVVAAAALYPGFRLCRGVELLESIYEEARAKVESCRRRPTDSEREEPKEDDDDDDDDPTAVDGGDPADHPEFALTSSYSELPLAPIALECGSFADPYGSFCDADIVFCFSTCLPDSARIELARSIGRQCRPGTVVVTTDYRLPSGGVLEELPDDPGYPTGGYAIEVVDSFSGSCAAVGGTSTVYVQRVVESVGTGIRRVRPELPLPEIAYRAILRAEDEKAERTAAFLRQVSNQMAFLGLPDSWRPDAAPP